MSQLNVSDLTWALASMAADGHQVRPELATALSTYNVGREVSASC
ncbi:MULTISPECIES: hypothetical protein [Rhizobium]|nr:MULTISPECIES: hypothetical protein [Rhizobium]